MSMIIYHCIQQHTSSHYTTKWTFECEKNMIVLIIPPNFILCCAVVYESSRLSAYWLRLQCLVCCQHFDLWSWLRALYWYPFHRWAVQVLCIVTAQGDGRSILLEGCYTPCTATTMARTSIKQKCIWVIYSVESK